MKNLYIMVLFSFMSTVTLAKKYQGAIYDENNKPLEFVNVVVSSINGEFITGTITDSTGNFTVEVDKYEKFIVELSFIGYKSKTIEVTSKSSNTLGDITLYENSVELEGVEVFGKKPIISQKVDRVVFNIENSTLEFGEDGMSVLKQTPGILVSDDKISIVGKSQVKVLINDRLVMLSGNDLTEYLSTLSSNEIKEIEVIKIPPSKYSSEGNSGLINIKLKESKSDSFNGYINSTYKRASNNSYFNGAGINYKKNKFSAFAYLNAGVSDRLVTEDNNIYYPTNKWESRSNINYLSNYISERLGMDYQLSENTTVGVQYKGSMSKQGDTGFTRTTIIDNNESLNSILKTDNSLDGSSNYHSLNAHMITKFDSSKKSLSIDVDYYSKNTSKDNKSITTNTSDYVNTIDNSNSQNVDVFTAQADFIFPYDNFNLNFGSKVSSISNNSSLYQLYIDNEHNEEQLNNYSYNENMQSVYASFDTEFDKWTFKMGLRLENTMINSLSKSLDESYDYNYLKLFPTFFTMYTINDENSLSAGYGRRINRPSYKNLNPYRWYYNPYSYAEGNPYLKPYYIDNVEITHTYDNNLSSSLYFSNTTDGVDQITLTDKDSEIQATVLDNFLNERAIGFTQSVSFDYLGFVSSYIQYNINYTLVYSDRPETVDKQSGYNYSVSIDNTFNLNKKKTLLGEVNFWYSSPSVSGVDYILENYSLDLGLKYSFEKISLSLKALDILKTNNYIIESNVNNIRQEYSNYYDSRQLRLSLRYTFGSDKIRSNRKKYSNSDEVKRSY
ncbi:TonB-dependent receptor domain-containing protein [Flammeovirga aprica]|uniref:TonB-dependent receptor n=1 Tax=Flammeovirga aprica JL-4 TaxID=694437 RepID=A0A7X9S233_9BACT|nr:outer membrane beta-barrel family protein [Flammeovirga aprica]NME72876.1 TonB-dependent receptor [Flammeovirga aprica JL-4]